MGLASVRPNSPNASAVSSPLGRSTSFSGETDGTKPAWTASSSKSRMSLSFSSAVSRLPGISLESSHFILPAYRDRDADKIQISCGAISQRHRRPAPHNACKGRRRCRCRAPSGRRQLLILGICALQRRTLAQTLDIAEEFGALGQQLEHHAEAQVGADHHVSGGELLAHDVGALAHRLGHDIHRRVEVAVTERPATGFLLAREGAVHHCGLDAARAEEQPLEIDAALRLADRDVELGLREFVGEIGADGGALGDDHVAMLERGHLAHWIDREKIRFAVVAVAQAQQMDIVGLADLLQHPSGDRRARGRGVVELSLIHI